MILLLKCFLRTALDFCFEFLIFNFYFFLSLFPSSSLSFSLSFPLSPLSPSFQISTALGYTGHLVHLLSKILQVTLRYEIIPGGSRSHIRDHLPSKTTAFSNVYPLYWRGVHAKKSFSIAMTLMQYNIDHLIRDRGVEMDYVLCLLPLL